MPIMIFNPVSFFLDTLYKQILIHVFKHRRYIDDFLNLKIILFFMIQVQESQT